ncbi:MAG: hypothetical protein GT597_14625 [Bacteroidales bacterium]|mgnify:FL=1|jgi:hypothetical protein|nr:hypothetical protein [Bacteroidales bacterium]MZQ49192.1 hypothetical protein [Bacteroidales bacterium]HPA87859.1 hypothetical protein [Bacteroidales bacterium]
MNRNDVIFALIVLTGLGISLYLKHSKKAKRKDAGTGNNPVQNTSGSGSFHSVRDGYEPYSGKHPGSGSGKTDA